MFYFIKGKKKIMQQAILNVTLCKKIIYIPVTRLLIDGQLNAMHLFIKKGTSTSNREPSSAPSAAAVPS